MTPRSNFGSSSESLTELALVGLESLGSEVAAPVADSVSEADMLPVPSALALAVGIPLPASPPVFSLPLPPQPSTASRPIPTRRMLTPASTLADAQARRKAHNVCASG